MLNKKGKKGMKEFEYIGVMASVVAYLLIVTGSYSIGFSIGIVASLSLSLYFITIKSMPSLALQLFFIAANSYGIISL
jgi:hypothetical protein